MILNIRDGDRFQIEDTDGTWILSDNKIRNENGDLLSSPDLIRILNQPALITVEGEDAEDYKSVFMEVNEKLTSIIIRLVFGILLLTIPLGFLFWDIFRGDLDHIDIAFMILGMVLSGFTGWNIRDLVRFIRDHWCAFV